MVKNLFHPVSVTLAIALKGSALCGLALPLPRIAIAAGLSLTSIQYFKTPQTSLLAAPSSATAINSIKADHVMLGVNNFESTMQWYKQKLGFKEVIRWKEPSLPGVDLAYLELNGFRIEILGGGTPQKAVATPKTVAEHTQTQGLRHLCFRVDDVDAVLAELKRRGVPTFSPAYDYPPQSVVSALF